MSGIAGITFIITCALYSPALIAIPWALLTQASRVRRILCVVILVCLATPFIVYGVFDYLDDICARGHIDQRFGECGGVSGRFANWIAAVVIYVPMIVSGLAAFYCLLLEGRYRQNR